MSATMISGYTGLLENQQVTQVARVIGIPITAEGAVVFGPRGIGGPTEKHNYVVMRDALFDAIVAHEADTQTEGEVFGLLDRWNRAVNDESNADEGLRRSVPARKKSVRDEIVSIYPVFIAAGQSDMIAGR